MRGNLTGGTAIADHLAPTREFLNTVLTLTRNSLLVRTRRLSTDEREALKKKYTMASERLVHEGAITGEIANIEATLQAEPENIVDLFTEQESVGTAVLPVNAAQQVENFSSPLAARASSASPEGSIELF